MGHATTMYYEQTITELQAMLQAVRDLHKPKRYRSQIDGEPESFCDNCHQNWPCETIDTLDGNK